MVEYKSPQIDLQNLTSEGRLKPEDYNKCLEYLRHLNEEANKYRDKENNPAQDTAFSFLETLPKEDSENLLEKIVEENIEIKIGGVSVKYSKKQ